MSESDLVNQAYTYFWIKVEDRGSIYITSDPPGAEVGLSGTFMGETPNTWNNLVPGTYTLLLTKDGYEDYTQSVEIRANQQATAHGVLTPEAPAMGFLVITSEPVGASVFVDGEKFGMTPATVPKPPGSHTVEVTKTGYVDYTGTHTVTAGQTTQVPVTLKATSATGDSQGSSASTGSISVTSDPSSAQVFVDGVAKGMTPKTITGVTPGSYTVSVSLTGYDGFSTTAKVVAGATTKVNADLTKQGEGATGTLKVRSQPSGASIKMDGYLRGVTPADLISIGAGSHDLVLTLTGYPDWKQSVTVRAGETVTVNAQMGSSAQSQGQQTTGSGQQAAATGTGALSVTTIPAGAQVYIDGNFVGNTPTTSSGLSAGSHRLRLAMSGYSDVAVPVTITAGQTTQYSTSMVEATPTQSGGIPGLSSLGVPGFSAILGVLAVTALVAGQGFIRYRQRPGKK